MQKIITVITYFVGSCLMLFMLQTASLLAQQHDNDSLRHAMQTASRESDRMHATVLLARSFLPAQMDSARVLLEQAAAIEHSRVDLHRADYYNARGLYYWFARDAQEAIYWYGRVLKLPKNKSTTRLKAAAANNIGVLYRRAGEPDSALYYLNRSLEIDMTAGNEEGMAKTLFDLSSLHFHLNRYELALQHIRKAISIQEQAGDRERLTHSHISLGNIYNALDSIDRAREAYEIALSMAETLGLEALIPINHNNLAATWSEQQGGLENTLFYAEKGLQKAIELNDTSTTIALYTNMGIAHSHAGMHDRAKEYLYNALDLLNRTTLPLKEVEVTCRLGHEYLLAGALTRSREYYDRSISIARQIKSLKHQHHCLMGLARLDSIEGNYKGYAANLHTAIALRDSIWNNERLARLDELHIIHETENKVLLISELDYKQKTTRLYFVITAIASSAFILLLMLMILYLRKKAIVAEQKRLLDQKNHELMHTELKAQRQELLMRILSLTRTEDVINNLDKKLQKFVVEEKDPRSKELTKLARQVRHSANTKDLMKEFEQRFNELNDDFISKLVERYPDLSPAEIRLCGMLRLQLSTKEIAELTKRSIRTIDYTRNNIRKKMNLDSSVNITTHILSV